MNNHAPVKVVSKRKLNNKTVEITKGIRTSIKVKNKLCVNGVQSKYKHYRHKITSLICLSKKRYYFDFFEKNTNNIKKTWKALNESFNNQRRKSRVLTKLKDPSNNNQITQNPSRLPNILNKHFANVGNLLASKLPKKDNYMSYLCKLKSPDSSLFFKPITSEEVKQEILSLPNNKTCGLYSCPTQLLKCSCNIISPALSHIFNLSVMLGAYPSKLKISKITPIYKSEDETDPSNYRPISLLSNFNRIFEKRLYYCMKEFSMASANHMPQSMQYLILKTDWLTDCTVQMHCRAGQYHRIQFYLKSSQIQNWWRSRLLFTQ